MLFAAVLAKLARLIEILGMLEAIMRMLVWMELDLGCVIERIFVTFAL
jgi:hypothetical protein